MNNYITERELKGFIPELSKYLWTGENNFDKQKIQAEQIVITDLANKGYLIRQLQPKIYLSTNSTEDTINGLRFVVEADGPGSVTLSGSNSNTYTDIVTINIPTAGTYSHIITNPFKYYVLDSDDFTCYLVEVTYDRLFSFKWLELILMDAFKEQGDSYYERMIYFKDNYEKLLNSFVINSDLNDDGEVSEDERTTTNSVNFTR